MTDTLIQKKQTQRKALLRALHALADGREGFTITPMQYLALGSQIGIGEETGHTIRYLVSKGLLAFKPASEAVALTHNGIDQVERQSQGSTFSDQEVTRKKLKALSDRILRVLKGKHTKIQMEELKEALPEFSDLPDSDWYSVINDLLSDNMIDARVVRSGIYDAVGAA